MLSLLPDLAPRDSHSLWYTSSRNPLSTSLIHDAYSPSHQHTHDAITAAGAANPHHRRGAHLVERSPLARLQADEQNLARRRANVGNFGSTWLKPPGISKTLHQLREERREAEEHQEALRREQLAQELAEAEAAGAAGGIGAAGVDALLDAAALGEGEDGVMDDVQLDGARDLDDDIPEADDFGLGSDDEEDEEEDEDEDDDEDDDDDDDDDPEQRAARTQQQLMAQRMRQADDAFRESMAQGRDSTHYYGADDEVDEEDQAQMIEEDDLIHEDGGDMDMDADLDDDIPEAEDAGYEHTDSEAELSSSEDDDQAEMSFAAQASQPRYRQSLARSERTRNSLAVSDILSHDASSILGSSPQIQRPPGGPTRRG
ncbi:Apc15p protein-domain-containing protein [Hypomontagnella monticulosa]|nr:Apc15p protein-domain-containing protein [Hypomontagnella monticulosa]